MALFLGREIWGLPNHNRGMNQDRCSKQNKDKRIIGNNHQSKKKGVLMKKIVIAAMVFLGMVALGFFGTSCSDTPTCPEGQSCQAPCPDQKECPQLSLSDFSFEVKEETKEYSEEELYIEKMIPLAVPSRSAEEVVNKLFEKLSPGFKETEDLSWPELFSNYPSDDEEMKSLYKDFYALVIANDPKLPKLIAEKLKGISGSKAMLSLWGHFFINKYQDIDWQAKVVFSKGQKVQKLFAWKRGDSNGQEIKTISKEEIYSEPLTPLRDTKTLFFITAGTPEKPLLKKNKEKPGVVLTPTFSFADEKLEGMSNMDKLIWRLGPTF